MIKVTNARFLQSCERFSQAPSILGAEIAILGRSNVGKSSLINALLNHKNLAKSSATPGKTRLINFFSAKWRVDSAESQNLGENNLSLQVDSQNLRNNTPYDSANPSPSISLDSFSQKGCTPLPAPPTHQKLRFSLLGGEPRFSASSKKSAGGTSAPFDSDFLHHEADEILGAPHGFNIDSSLRLRSAQNDNLMEIAESSADSAIFPLDSALSTQKANYAITDEFLGFCEVSDEDRTQVHRGSEPKQSLKSRCESEFEIRILDFPGFGYARVSKAEKSSWDRHLSEFLNKRDSIKLYLHLIDARHQNLAIDNEIFAFLNRFKRGDSAILQVFTKADKLCKNELFRLKKQHKFYHAINDKNSTEILRWAILKLLYNVDSVGFANSQKSQNLNQGKCYEFLH